MPGWDVTTVEPLKPGLLCQECKLLLRDPVQTNEGDRLCRSCFDDLKRTGASKSGVTLGGEEAVSYTDIINARVSTSQNAVLVSTIIKMLIENHSYNAIRIKQ